MARRINQFSNGGYIEFDTGNFDDWCVYVTRTNGNRFAPSDLWYFSRLEKLSKKYGRQIIYDDFIVVYNRTTQIIEPSVFELIAALSKSYSDDSLEMEIWLNVLYAGMIAEENKANAKLGKRVKRLGMHQLLMENMSPEDAAVFSRGKKWKALDKLMNEKGF